MNKLGHGTSSSRNLSNNQNRNRRQQQQQHRSTDGNDAAQDRRPVAAQAHTRAPVLTREPTALESFSRNFRTLLPTSISGSPPTPRRRPLSFGGVIGAYTNIVPPARSPSDKEVHVLTPGEEDGECIIWAAWDELGPTRVLLLAYMTGLQIWNTSNLGAVRELLNLRIESLQTAGPVLCAAILPSPVEGTDEFESVRPLLGIITPTHFTVCSLVTHAVVKQISFTGASTIVARPAFIVISTTHPHILHILSSRTFMSIHTITLPTPPIFALSLRLLAYASPAPISYKHGPPSPTFISHSRDSLSSSVMRMGGEVWSGVKAAVATSAASMGADDIEHTWGVTRSAPAASNLPGRWPHNHPDGQAPHDIHGPRPHTPGASSGWITVVDLMPLLSSSASASQDPRPIACFAPFPPEPSGIAHLTFAGVGAMPMLCVAPRDGQRVAVFQIRPGAAVDTGYEDRTAEMPWHWYDLRRGLTSARVENVVWEKAGRWVGVATGRRTVHVFPTNPYGGKPDERSHQQAKVYNAVELQPLSTEVTPLVRLRPTPNLSAPDSIDIAPLAFTFLPLSASLALPPALVPQPTPSTPLTSTPTRSTRSSPVSLSPTPGSGPTSYQSHIQDILLLDPVTGVLSLRRVTVDWAAPPESAAGLTYSVNVPGTSGYNMSLPIPMGKGWRRSDTGEKQGELVGKESVVATWALKREREWAEIKSATPATAPVKPDGTNSPPEGAKASVADYLAQAELSTHSRSPAVLPRPIYLSHQFSFHALSEDYDALLRRSQLDVPCTKIEVRKDVEVSAYADDAESDAFIQGAVDLKSNPSSKSRDRRAGRGSFDEPIASAMQSGLDYSGQSPPVLPMLPNGAFLSVLDTIPIHTKHVAAGVNEGLGRIRREIGKVRSPTLRPTRPEGRPEGRHVPLEFDEEDEAAFLEGEADADADADVDREDHEGTSHDDGSGSGASASVSTPSSRSRADLGAGDGEESMWDAWDDEARATVAEAETFDEISATGFMDEEHAPIMAAMTRQQGKGKGKVNLR